MATGLADGLGLGENARAALVTRGLAEITRLAVALGGEPATLAGLAGLGDLVLTCHRHALAQPGARHGAGAGRDREPARSSATRMVAEGVPTVRSALALADRHGVTLPICGGGGGGALRRQGAGRGAGVAARPGRDAGGRADGERDA